MKEFQGKVALITGGASGIGKTLSEHLAKQGARVILADIQDLQVKEVAEAIREGGEKATGVRLDVTDADAVQAVVRSVVEEYGHLDLMINNAGIGVVGETKDCSLEDWRRTIDINLNGVVYGVHAAYPVMIEQGNGHIVNVASLAGLIPAPKAAAYSATKHAVVGLSLSLRAEASRYGVNVNVVCPAFVKTPLLTESKVIKIPRKKVDAMMSAMGKPMSPDQCVKSILKGIQRNDAIITMPLVANVAWRVHRLTPTGIHSAQKVAGKVLKLFKK